MEEKNPIQVADRLFHALELLAENGAMGLKELSDSLKLNKSTAHRVVTSLIYLGYARQEEETGKYEPTFKVVHLANQIMGRVEMVSLLRPYLQKLMERAGETVHFVERDGNEAVYIDKIECFQNSIQMVSRIGNRIPLYCSGVGKAILADLSDAEIQAVWENSRIEQRTEHTITKFQEFQKEIQEIRKKGYAVDREENERGVRCVAVSLSEPSGRSAYAFSISAPIDRMTEERIGVLAGELLKTKEEIGKMF